MKNKNYVSTGVFITVMFVWVVITAGLWWFMLKQPIATDGILKADNVAELFNSQFANMLTIIAIFGGLVPLIAYGYQRREFDKQQQQIDDLLKKIDSKADARATQEYLDQLNKGAAEKINSFAEESRKNLQALGSVTQESIKNVLDIVRDVNNNNRDIARDSIKIIEDVANRNSKIMQDILQQTQNVSHAASRELACGIHGLGAANKLSGGDVLFSLFCYLSSMNIALRINDEFILGEYLNNLIIFCENTNFAIPENYQTLLSVLVDSLDKTDITNNIDLQNRMKKAKAALLKHYKSN